MKAVGTKRSGVGQRAAMSAIEVLIVVVLLAIVATVLVPALGDSAIARLRGSANLLARDLQYVQSEAIQTGQTLRVRFVSGTQYLVEDPDGGVGGTAQVLRHPQSDYPAHDGQYVIDFDDPGPLRGTTIASAAFGGESWVEFGKYGEPTASGEVVLHSGRYRVRIAVAPVTGVVSIGELEGSP